MCSFCLRGPLEAPDSAQLNPIAAGDISGPKNLDQGCRGAKGKACFGHGYVAG